VPRFRDFPDSVTRLRIGMGTTIAVSAETDALCGALPGIGAAYAAVAQVERLMHPTRSGSDLLAIRRVACGRPLAVHAWTWEVLALSKRLNELTNGLFDPCRPGSPGRLEDLELASPYTVVAHAPLCIDLGGIAKGYAVDRALLALRASGCRGGLVNAGGDMAVFGDDSHPIVIRGAGGAGGIVQLKNRALASSDVCGATRPAEHCGYYHGVTRRLLSAGRVSVSAASAAVADALTKCLLVDRGEMSSALLEIFDARLAVFEFDS
jgi:thiamine biosynthesis lipoprotein